MQILNLGVVLCVKACLFAMCGLSVRANAMETNLLDGFEDAGTWKAIAATGVGLVVTNEAGKTGNALRVDYDFTKGSGFVIVQKDFGMMLPDPATGKTYEFSFDAKGDAIANDLEFKLLDTRGDAGAQADRSDVWWHQRRAFTPMRDWQTLTTRVRHVTFAWGPSHGTPTRKVDKIEFAIAAIQGGKGTIWLDNLMYREIDAPPTTPPAVEASASSSMGGSNPANVLDENDATVWGSSGNEQMPLLNMDLGIEREFGGVEVLIADVGMREIELEGSSEATPTAGSWKLLAKLEGIGANRVIVWAPESSARHIRLGFNADAPAGIAEVRLISPEIGASRNSLMAYVAQRDARLAATIAQETDLAGLPDLADLPDWPDMFFGKQRYWTVVGLPDDDAEALISEQGVVEVGKGLFTLDGVIRTLGASGTMTDGRMIRLSACAKRVSLDGGWMPIPSVEGETEGFATMVTALATGMPGASTILVRYAITNTGNKVANGWFSVAGRPFQVNPVWQDLKATGGVAPTKQVAAVANGFAMDGRRVLVNPAPLSVVGSTFAGGEVMTGLRGMGTLVPLAGSSLARVDSITDSMGMVSGATEHLFTLSPGETKEWIVAVALGAERDSLAPVTPEEFAKALEVERARWTNEVDKVKIRFADKQLNDAIRSTLAYILINADGPSIQPGSRCYERSWIRDGSMTSAALLEYGLMDRAVRFIDWYGAYVYPDGKVPCVVDKRGADPVDEHDSHGQYIFAVMNAYRYTKDTSILERHWNRVDLVANHIQSLRMKRMSAEFQVGGPARQEPGKAAVPAEAFYGIMPESISHEGYSAKPMHSFWDGFFTLRGLRDASAIARILGKQAESERFAGLAEEFRTSHYAAMRASMKAHEISYMPGCVELGDFDSTSTTVALWPGDDLKSDTRAMLETTFEKYMAFFRARRDGGQAWEGLTPYEWRHVGALARLGRREDGQEVLAWFMGLRRPLEWNHWAEVVWNEPSTPRFIGDMPHTWCGSDFLNSVRATLVYEKDQSLMVFGGIVEEVAREGVLFEGMPTEFGKLSARLSVKQFEGRDRFVVELSGDAKPKAGIVVASPMDEAGRASENVKVWVNGSVSKVDAEGGARVFSLPSKVEFERAE